MQNDSITEEEFLQEIEKIENVDNILQEENIIKYDKKTRLNKLTAQIATELAKSEKDQLYIKLSKFNKMRLGFKKQIQKKYASKARFLALQRIKTK